MKKVLCLFAHPNPAGSRANSLILRQLQTLPQITIHNLYEMYPEFDLDVEREQKALADHDILMLQHPFYWYNMPPLLKLWMDLVLEYDFAYGPKGKALQGKEMFLSITTGGAASSYQPSGYNNFPIEAFFPSYIQTANLCGMKWLPPMVLHHSLRVSDQDLEAHARKVRERVMEITE